MKCLSPLEKLNFIFQGNEEADRTRLNALLSRIRPERSSRFVLFGAGPLGRHINYKLQSLGNTPLAFVDNNPALWGTEVDGIRVFSPSNAATEFGEKTIFIAAIYTNSPLKSQLRKMGVSFLSFPELAWSFPETFLPHGALALSSNIYANKEALGKCLQIWSDDKSKEEFVAQIAWRTSLDASLLPLHSSADETYFPDDLFVLHNHEVLVDCGAFDGDSLAACLKRTKGEFSKIIGIEADLSNFEKLRASLNKFDASKVSLIPKAVGAFSGKVRFDATGTAGSIVGSGSTEVDCVALDDIMDGIVPTFIKMDIEGSEPAALCGAEKLISKHRPVLAICLYHAQEHLWEIPLHLKSLVPDYRLFLRRYCDECWELVCYAVPIERCKI